MHCKSEFIGIQVAVLVDVWEFPDFTQNAIREFRLYHLGLCGCNFKWYGNLFCYLILKFANRMRIQIKDHKPAPVILPSDGPRDSNMVSYLYLSLFTIHSGSPAPASIPSPLLYPKGLTWSSTPSKAPPAITIFLLLHVVLHQEDLFPTEKDEF